MATRPTAASSTRIEQKATLSAAAVSMMGGPQIVWTALPNGVVGTGDQRRIKLSVFVSPRLKSGDDDSKDSLSKYPDFIDWPAKIRGIQFSVAFDSGPTVDATKVSADPESELWKALFKPLAPVKNYKFGEFHERPILSYPVSHVQAFVKNKYLSVASQPAMVAELPRLEDLASYDMFGQIAFRPHPEYVAAAQLRGIVAPAVNIASELTQELGQVLKTQKVIPSRAAPEPQKDFVQYMMYSAPMATQKVPLTPPELDFHRALSSLGKYPQLMRKLGLVVDLEIPWRSDIPAGASSSTVKIVPKWGSGPKSSGDNSVKTKYILSENDFIAAPHPGSSDIQGRMLRLGDPTFDVVQVDVESAAEKTMEFANNLTAKLASLKPHKSETAGLPTLRSAGISVVRKERDKKMRERLLAAAAANMTLISRVNAMRMHGSPGAEPETINHADDLMRGLRVDVWDSSTNAWHSLCRRMGRYEFLDGGAVLQIEDEGFVSSAVTGPPGKATRDTEVRLHEALFRWDGWSLCASRYGKTIGTDDKPAAVDNTPGPDFRMKTSFLAVPGSLPKLRFGTTYRLRARVVDLAGNSLGYDEPDPNDASVATHPIVYGRFEPVTSPMLALRQDVKPQSTKGTRPGAPIQITGGSPGESVGRLVIRSFNDAPPKDTVPTNQQTERHVAPPKGAQQMAETHGMFDPPTGSMADKTFDSPSGKKDSYTTILENDGSLKEVEPAEQLSLPYLPDAIALGASLAGLPGASEVGRVDFYTDLPWPEAKPFRIRLVDGTGAPQWDAGSRVLSVHLPKAEVVTFSLSSYIPDKWLPPMGVWNWLEEAAGLRPLETMKVIPIPQATPTRSKVRLPVQRLNFVQPRIGAVRPAAATPIGPAPQAAKRIDALSAFALAPIPQINTSVLRQIRDISLQGRNWMFTPPQQVTLVHAVQQPLMIPTLQIGGGKNFIGDTFALLSGKVGLHGKSTGKIDIAAEWEEPVDPISEPKWRMLSGKAHVGEQMVKPQDTELQIKLKRHDFGDTKYRRVRYSVAASTRFREYFAPTITSDPKNISRTSQMVEVDIPNSARPDAPRILYVIPTFGWKIDQQQQTVTRTRYGGGLRVYLDRPWFSSGDGELLGVVIPLQGGGILKAAPHMPSEPLKGHVTQWGMDPIWMSGQTYDCPLFEHFKKAVKEGNNLSLVEIKSSEDPKRPRVSVSGHAVQYDETRQLWYSDIEIDAGPSYFPFVRLALARYQPNSIDNAHLSRVVITDFAQLAPDRTATITRLAPGQLKVTVTGVSYSAGGAGSGSSQVEVSVEARQEGTEGDVGWIPVSDAVFPLQHPQGLLAKVKGSLWTGDIKLPELAGKKLRLVIKEYEVFREDAPPVTLSASVIIPTERRLVYADVLEI